MYIKRYNMYDVPERGSDGNAGKQEKHGGDHTEVSV